MKGLEERESVGIYRMICDGIYEKKSKIKKVIMKNKKRKRLNELKEAKSKRQMNTILGAQGYKHIKYVYDEERDTLEVYKTPMIAFEYKSTYDKENDMETQMIYPISMFGKEIACDHEVYATEDPQGLIKSEYDMIWKESKEFEEATHETCKRLAKEAEDRRF